MQSKHDAVIVFCSEDLCLAPELVSFSSGNVLSLTEFAPDGQPAIFVAGPEHLETASQVLQQMSATARAQSVITGRVPRGENLPVQQPLGVAFVPWSSEEPFAQWLAVLRGAQPELVSPHWFLLHTCQGYNPSGGSHLLQARQELPHGSACQWKLENLAKATHCSMRQLGKLFHEKLGMTPGLLLRVMVIFSDTAKLMQEETSLLNGKRRGHSPLRSQRNDYRRRLQRLLGMTYSELRHTAKTEHWAVMWMRKWRERLKRETGREDDGEKRRAVDLEEMIALEN